LITYIIVILIIFILLFFWIYRLKKEVNIRKNTEKKLLEKESHLYDVQKYALIGHWEILANGTTHWSDNMYRLFGLSPKVNPGPDSFSTIISTADFLIYKHSIDNSFATGEEHYFQCKIVRPSDNQERWIDCRGKVALDDKNEPYKVTGFIQDITEQKVSVALLHESEDKYRAMFETALVGMVLNDKDGTLLEVNQAYLDIIGYTNDEVHKLTFWDVTPENYQEQENSQLKSLKEQGKYGPYEKEYIHKDGHLVPVILNGVAVIGSDNEAYTWSSIHDITDRKQVELREKSRSHVLELITSDEELPVILESIIRGVEEENSVMLCSILLLDVESKHLLSGAAPSLPNFYNKAINGIEIGLEFGSCSAAAFTNERVIVEDIQKSPYWTSYKELASKARLKACWSEPIRSTKGKVLGTFAVYHHEIYQPTEENIILIEQATSLASIAIEKIQANLALKASDEQMQLVLAGAELGFWDWNIITSKVERNERWATMLGYTYKELEHTTHQWADFVHPQDRDRAWKSINDVLEGRSKSHSLEYRMLTKKGDYIWVHDQANVMQRHCDGKPLRMSGTHSDITSRKLAEEKLKLAASVFTHARESIIITDITGIIIDVNDTFTTITGYSREEVIGKNPRIIKSGRQSPKFYADMWQVLLEEGYWYGELWNRRKSGEVYAEMKTISAVRDEQGITTHYVSLANDITQIKEHQDQLERIAHYDILTSLPNRSLLSDRLYQAMLQCNRHAQSLAVVFLDLDGFKTVNDAYGHDMGDELLIALSGRMKEALREGDSLARIGGDEFVAVLTDLSTVKDCELVLERLLLAASEPIIVEDLVLNVSASIGVTLYPQDNVDADQLMRHADQAMYVAKESGKNQYHLFDTAQDDAVKVQRESLEAIRSALDNHQFVLYYQPKVNMKTGKVTGVEALIRWQHPKRGLLNPIEFLPVIEHNPMMIELGEWVIDSALAQISQWQAKEHNLPVNISVNIAAIQLQQPDFTQRLTILLAAHPDVESRYLELEVLETSALEDVHHISTTMNACMALGVNFALDDFGTGYSSLTYLRRLPANIIKIDQTFVRDMLIDIDDLAIVEGVIALAKSFKREVIAEGVETIEHGTALLQLGCDLAQGYGIARPMPASDIPVWINNWAPDVSW
jgi:diguanylate cyclase (GGDEF)-like protein/PAS domain S-box-containing protein